jgi:hypothetical protein
MPHVYYCYYLPLGHIFFNRFKLEQEPREPLAMEYRAKKN